MGALEEEVYLLYLLSLVLIVIPTPIAPSLFETFFRIKIHNVGLNSPLRRLRDCCDFHDDDDDDDDDDEIFSIQMMMMMVSDRWSPCRAD